jgi:hypothetical protein
VSSSVKLAAARGSIRTAHLFRAEFKNSDTGATEIYHFTDNHRHVEFEGQTYTALGHLLGYEGIQESSDFQISTVRVTLSAVDQALIASLLLYDYIDRELDIWRCFFTIPADVAAGSWDDSGSWDDDGFFSETGQTDQLIADPVKIFSGRMGEPVIAEDPVAGNNTISLTASSHFSDFERRPGRHTNHSEQQAYFLGDRFFEGWGNPDEEVVWGGV